jgi:phosphoglycerate dehydrogenase-like enzyme
MTIKIGILSRNHQQYEKLLRATNSQQSIVKYGEIISSSEPSDFLNSDVTILLANPNLAANIVHSLPNLEWIQSTWAGVNRLIFQDKKNYRLTGLKNIFGQKMSEYVFAYLLYLTRQISSYQLLQQDKKWEALPPQSLNNKVFGIMGMGNIGGHLAKHAKLFGMQVNALSRTSHSDLANQHFSIAKINDFAGMCDVIVNVLPETPDTVGLCDSTFFRNMKSDAIFINVGRGSVIEDEIALDHILSSGHLRAAVIDVCRQEPLPKDHPFWTNSKVFLTNHTAAVSDINDVFDVFWANLQKFVANKPISGEIDFDKGY